MMNFNKTADELYQLCRRVQEETQISVKFEVVNYKVGKMINVCVYGDFNSESSTLPDMYNICENGYQEEENTQKVREHLNRLLMNKPCPYCEVSEDGK